MSLERFETWRNTVEKTLPSKTVGAPYPECHTEGQTYADFKIGEAYTFQDHKSIEEATAFSERLIHCYDEAMWRETTWNELVDFLKVYKKDDSILLTRKHTALWEEFQQFEPLAQKVFILGHMACDTWEMSHFCFVFQLGPDRFVNFRADLSDRRLFYTAIDSPRKSYYYGN